MPFAPIFIAVFVTSGSRSVVSYDDWSNPRGLDKLRQVQVGENLRANALAVMPQPDRLTSLLSAAISRLKVKPMGPGSKAPWVEFDLSDMIGPNPSDVIFTLRLEVKGSDNVSFGHSATGTITAWGVTAMGSAPRAQFNAALSVAAKHELVVFERDWRKVNK